MTKASSSGAQERGNRELAALYLLAADYDVVVRNR